VPAQHTHVSRRDSGVLLLLELDAMTERANRIRQIQGRIGNRKLVWFGTRGSDALPLLDIEQFEDCFSIIAPLDSIAIQQEVCLESMTMQRVDLDNYTIDLDRSDAVEEFHRLMYSTLGQPSLVAIYRPNAFFTSIYYPRAFAWDGSAPDTRLQYLGLFHERQVAFEHKPWVETELRLVAGAQVLRWQYFGDEDRERLAYRLSRGPQVVRTSRSDGGVGLRIIHDADELRSQWPAHGDRFVAATDYLQPNIPLNVNAVVFADGTVSVHGPSLQLIGLPDFTNLPLGYCGNDFAAIKDLDDDALDGLEDLAVRAGRWLASQGYRGAFGIDALLYRGTVYLTEVNPRFQGSSSLSADLDRALDRADMFLNHIAAFLGLEPPPSVPLRTLARTQPQLAHVVCHNNFPDSVDVDLERSEALDLELQLVPHQGVAVEPDAAAFRAVFRRQVTEEGFRLSAEVADPLRAVATAAIRAHIAPATSS
jgi:hypothetical protein